MAGLEKSATHSSSLFFHSPLRHLWRFPRCGTTRLPMHRHWKYGEAKYTKSETVSAVPRNIDSSPDGRHIYWCLTSYTLLRYSPYHRQRNCINLILHFAHPHTLFSLIKETRLNKINKWFFFAFHAMTITSIPLIKRALPTFHFLFTSVGQLKVIKSL